MKKNNILKTIRKNKNELARFHVKKIGLFGSHAKNRAKKSSDIDFVVEFEKGKKNFKNFMDLAFFLEKIFKKKVDLLTIESINPYFKTSILKEAHFEKIENL